MAQTPTLYPCLRHAFFPLFGNVRPNPLCCVQISSSSLDSTAERQAEGAAEGGIAGPETPSEAGLA